MGKGSVEAPYNFFAESNFLSRIVGFYQPFCQFTIHFSGELPFFEIFPEMFANFFALFCREALQFFDDFQAGHRIRIPERVIGASSADSAETARPTGSLVTS